jgi:hypothetical protein
MADNAIKAPLGATHCYTADGGTAYYRFDGHVWKYWNILHNQWVRCTDNKPAYTPTPLPPSEQSLCCGTTCDKRNVAAYITRLEAVAEAARALPATAGSESLRAALAEVYL